MHPRLTARVEQARPMPVLLWQFAEPRLCVSSGPLGGGIGARDWVVNATVPLDYHRTDPDRHLTEIGNPLKLVGAGCGLLTAVDVSRHHLATDGGVHAAATVGLCRPATTAERVGGPPNGNGKDQGHYVGSRCGFTKIGQVRGISPAEYRKREGI
jgi:adenosylcobinamide hydrolase